MYTPKDESYGSTYKGYMILNHTQLYSCKFWWILSLNAF